jgi:hypothetical protein
MHLDMVQSAESFTTTKTFDLQLLSLHQLLAWGPGSAAGLGLVQHQHMYTRTRPTEIFSENRQMKRNNQYLF